MNLVKINEIVARAPIHHPGTWQRKDGLQDGQPDIAVLQEGRREAPPFPLERAFGAPLSKWVTAVAENANSPIDYVAGSLLAATAAVIGNARAAKAFEDWEEPSVLWIGLLGDPSTSKSPVRTPAQKSLTEAAGLSGFAGVKLHQ